MHEFNACQTIVETVLEQASKRGSRVVKATLVLGRLRQLVPEYLQASYEELTKGTAAEGSILEIVYKPAVFLCESCAAIVDSESVAFECTSCGSRRGRVDGGRELYIDSLELAD